MLEGENIVGESYGSVAVSRAEDLLPNINHLLSTNRIAKDEIGSVAISLGPGSYTGLRIGIATVMGLCRGLEIGHIGIDLFDAIDRFYNKDDSPIVLPMGKSDICIRESKDSGPRVISAEDLKIHSNGRRMLAHPQLSVLLQPLDIETIDIGTNLAKYVGLAAIGKASTEELRPIYLQNPRFG